MVFSVDLRFPSLDRAIQKLRDGRPGESGYGRRVALLLAIPPADDPVALDVRRAHGGELYVVRTTWQRALDLASLRATRPVPFSGGARTEIRFRLASNWQPSVWSIRITPDPRMLELLFQRVASATITCCPQQAEPPLDATTYEVTFGDELNETRYRWSGEPPVGWTPLAEFARGLARLAGLTSETSTVSRG